MKIFDFSFFSGTVLVAIGIPLFIVGALFLIPPNNDWVRAAILLVLGASCILFGRKMARKDPPVASKVAIETLRKAGMLDGKEDKQKQKKKS